MRNHKKFRRIVYVTKASLKDGHHTSFELLQCQDCGLFTGFPDSNFCLAIREGTEGSLRDLISRMIICPVNLDNPCKDVEACSGDCSECPDNPGPGGDCGRRDITKPRNPRIRIKSPFWAVPMLLALGVILIGIGILIGWILR